MANKNFLSRCLACLLLCSSAIIPLSTVAQETDGLGQTIQIYTRFRSYIGKPTWLFIIRDIDHNQTVPYFFEVKRGDNFWLAYTYGRNYLVSVSTMQIETYRSRYNNFKNYKIRNFCHLESNGHILRGESLYITIDGDLTPHSESYTCHVSRFKEANFAIATPDSIE